MPTLFTRMNRYTDPPRVLLKNAQSCLEMSRRLKARSSGRSDAGGFLPFLLGCLGLIASLAVAGFLCLWGSVCGHDAKSAAWAFSGLLWASGALALVGLSIVYLHFFRKP